MKYYTIVFPGEYGQHVQETWNNEQILKFYWKHWNVKMFQSGNGDLVTEERCIEDWIITHWAEETDEFGNKLINTCHCHKCVPIEASKPESVYMRLCPECGNKRCPKASDHNNPCTNSNEPNQVGSIY
jgi:hypothetical protein